MSNLPDPFSTPPPPGLRPSSDRVEFGERRSPDGTLERWVAFVRTYVPWSSGPPPTVVTAAAAAKPWTRAEWRTLLRWLGPLGYGLVALYVVLQPHNLVALLVTSLALLLPLGMALWGLCHWGGVRGLGLLTFGALFPPIGLAVVLVCIWAALAFDPAPWVLNVLWLVNPAAIAATALATLALEERSSEERSSCRTGQALTRREHGGGQRRSGGTHADETHETGREGTR